MIPLTACKLQHQRLHLFSRKSCQLSVWTNKNFLPINADAGKMNNRIGDAYTDSPDTMLYCFLSTWQQVSEVCMVCIARMTAQILCSKFQYSSFLVPLCGTHYRDPYMRLLFTSQVDGIESARHEQIALTTRGLLKLKNMLILTTRHRHNSLAQVRPEFAITREEEKNRTSSLFPTSAWAN